MPAILKLIYPAILSSLVIMGGCEHNTYSCRACGEFNPTENIKWLKDVVENINDSEYRKLSGVDVFENKSGQLIVVSWTLINVYDLPGGSIYNCNGKLLHSCGGNQPVDSCSVVLNNSVLLGSALCKE